MQIEKAMTKKDINAAIRSMRIRKIHMLILVHLRGSPAINILDLSRRISWRAFRLERLEVAVARLRNANLVRMNDSGSIEAHGVPEWLTTEIDRRQQGWKNLAA